MNSDYKIIALLIAKRSKSVLDNIIDESQSGFLRSRQISNNIRLVLDILDNSELILNDSFMLFLDFYKEFDSTEHVFLSLKKIGLQTCRAKN